MSFKDLENKVFNDLNNQDNYDHLQGTPMDPGDHSIDNIPEAKDQRWGDMLGAPNTTPYSTTDTKGDPKRESNPVHKHTMPSGTTKTGKKKR